MGVLFRADAAHLAVAEVVKPQAQTCNQSKRRAALHTTPSGGRAEVSVTNLACTTAGCGSRGAHLCRATPRVACCARVPARPAHLKVDKRRHASKAREGAAARGRKEQRHVSHRAPGTRAKPKPPRAPVPVFMGASAMAVHSACHRLCVK